MIAAPKAVIFDLDGTLVDSAPHCALLVNEMLDERDAPHRVTPDDARQFLTRGGKDLVAALMGDACADVDGDVADFRRRYATMPTPPSCLFEGVRDGLDSLRDAGVTMAICSNKPQHLCEKIVDDLDLAAHFAAVVGSQDGTPLKPDPALAARALDGLGRTRADTLYVGDSDVDRRTAQAIGLPFLFVTYGYAEPDLDIASDGRFDRFDEVVTYLSRQVA